MAGEMGDTAGTILIGKSPGKFERLILKMGNRHGLVTGATGTGKTVSLQTLVEGFSNAGVPVIAADVKGDLAGLACAGDGRAALLDRAKAIGMPYEPDRFPVVFWDVLGEQGHPIRATIADMGPLLVARLLGLNAVQEGVLNIAFRVADEQGLLLLDLKDLRAMLQYIADNAADLTRAYGNVSAATIGTIQRALLVLESQGATLFLGEPALEITDLLGVTRDGRGVVNVLAADKLVRRPQLYATFLLWLLSELFEQLPEIGDPEKPKLVFFFDEAHLLFDDAPKSLIDAIQQVVRLIRSKGVGVYFVTQNPLDVPDTVLGQLGNRIQHALRAFTPRDQRAVKAAADTFRQNPGFDTADAITKLAVGEALVSMMQADGTPEIVERTLVAPPTSRVGPITPAERQSAMAADPVGVKYDTSIDRESAFEMLKARAEGRTASASAPQSPWGQPQAGRATQSPWGQAPQGGPAAPSPPLSPWGQPGPAQGHASPPQPSAAPPPAAAEGGILGELGGALTSWWNGGGSTRGRMTNGQLITRSVVQSAARSVGTQIAREVLRGVMGGMQR